MPLHILIADDSATNRVLFETVVTRMGHRADMAASGAEAIAFLEKHAYDIAFVDLQMPQLDGYALAKKIRQNGPHRTPLYAISGYIGPEIEERALAAGFSGCLAKPLDREKILRIAAGCGLDEKLLSLPSAADAARDVLPPAAHDIPKRLLGTYARELRARAAACERHWQQGNLAGLQQEAHTLRALADMLKTAEVSRAAARVEHMPPPDSSLLDFCRAPHGKRPSLQASCVRALHRACLYAAAAIEKRAPGPPAS
jgi:CheY-like chemotaxis protein